MGTEEVQVAEQKVAEASENNAEAIERRIADLEAKQIRRELEKLPKKIVADAGDDTLTAAAKKKTRKFKAVSDKSKNRNAIWNEVRMTGGWSKTPGGARYVGKSGVAFVTGRSGTFSVGGTSSPSQDYKELAAAVEAARSIGGEPKPRVASLVAAGKEKDKFKDNQFKAEGYEAEDAEVEMSEEEKKLAEAIATKAAELLAGGGDPKEAVMQAIKDALKEAGSGGEPAPEAAPGVPEEPKAEAVATVEGEPKDGSPPKAEAVAVAPEDGEAPKAEATVEGPPAGAKTLDPQVVEWVIQRALQIGEEQPELAEPQAVEAAVKELLAAQARAATQEEKSAGGTQNYRVIGQLVEPIAAGGTR